MTEEQKAEKLQLIQFFVGLGSVFNDHTAKHRQELLEWFVMLPDFQERYERMEERIDRLRRWEKEITAWRSPYKKARQTRKEKWIERKERLLRRIRRKSDWLHRISCLMCLADTIRDLRVGQGDRVFLNAAVGNGQ